MEQLMTPIFFWFSKHIPAAYAIVFFCLGAAAGSFINVVACRLPHGLSLICPPSSCPRCGRRILGLDNLPIISWLFLKGRCRHCRAAIHWRYPAVEMASALLWAGLGYRHATLSLDCGHWQGIGLAMAEALFVSALIAASLIDFDHRIIPDEISLGGLLATFPLAALLPAMHLPHHLEISEAFRGAAPYLVSLLSAFLGALAGGGILLIMTVVGTMAFRKRLEKIRQTEDPEATTAVGLGDVKLMAWGGSFLGWKAIIAAFFLGTLIGAFLGIVEKIASGRWPKDGEKAAEPEFFLETAFLAFFPLPRRWREAMLYRWQTGTSLMPYGPALCCGLLLLLFFRQEILLYLVKLLWPNPAMGESGIQTMPPILV